MNTTLIIGYGNLLRRDDGLGVYAVEELQNRLKDSRYTFVMAHQLQPEMIEQIIKANLVIFVDADNGSPAGKISRSFLNADCHDENSTETLSGTHLVSPEWLLSMGQKFYGRRPIAVMFTMSGADFSLGEGLSSIVMARLQAFITQIERFIVEEVSTLKMR